MNAVRELRLRKGIQQKEVAMAIGVSRPTVSEWEHQKKDPTGDRLRKLAEFFDVTTAMVLGLDPLPIAPPNSITDEDDLELWEAREAARNDPNRRVLFKLARSGTASQVRQMVSLLDAMRATNPEFYEDE